jgi:hypothetical protein
MDLRAKKKELGITVSEQSSPPHYSEPAVSTSEKRDDHILAVSAIASATIQIDNAIQEVSKISTSNRASLEGLPIVMDDMIDYDGGRDSYNSTDNLLFEQPVEALEISDNDLDILLSTTARSQLDLSRLQASKKDLLSSLLTQAAHSQPVRPSPKTVTLSASTLNNEKAAPIPVAAPVETEFEIELDIEPEPEVNKERISVERESSAWEIETSPEVIERFKKLTLRYDQNELNELLQSIEELTGFNLPEMYPEILIRDDVAAVDPEPPATEAAPVTVMPEAEAEIPEVVADRPDFPAMWDAALTASHDTKSSDDELGALDLLEEPDRRFIDPLFERLLEKDEFDPNARKPAVSPIVERRSVESSDLQLALMMFVKEEEESTKVSSVSTPEPWSGDIPTEFGDASSNRSEFVFATILGCVCGIGGLFFTRENDVFSISNLLFSIFTSSSSSLMLYAGSAVLCRIVFWGLLAYPVIRFARSRLSTRNT